MKSFNERTEMLDASLVESGTAAKVTASVIVVTPGVKDAWQSQWGRTAAERAAGYDGVMKGMAVKLTGPVGDAVDKTVSWGKGEPIKDPYKARSLYNIWSQ